MSVFTKKAVFEEFQGVQADSVLLAATKKVAEAAGIEADLKLYGVVADIAGGVLKAPADIQGQYVAEQAKKGKRLPDGGDNEPYGDNIDPKMVSFAELPTEVQETMTQVFNLVRAELAAVGRV